MANDLDPIDLAAVARTIGTANELAPKDKARLKLAGWILLALFLLTLFSGLMLVFAPCGRVEQASEFFGYIKAAVPPLVTLVIGFYFQANSD